MNLWARQLALGLLLTTAIPSAAVQAADSAEQILLDKANYWRLKDRPDLARDALDKVLAINPGQADALYAYGMLEVQQGNVAEARNYLSRLQKSAATDRRLGELQSAIAAGRVETADLNEARRLGESGDYGDAVRKYQQTFRGPAPASYGVEYYLTLAATPAGRDEAHRALEQMAKNSPTDAAIKLALAQVSTYSEATRPEGIAMLSQLSTDPAVGPAAVRAWHQALLWLGGTHRDRALYQEYLARYSQDTEIRAHLEEVPPDTEVADKRPSIDYQAYLALQQGSLGGAEGQFSAALKLHPDDTDALAGLGMVRLRQARFADARDLLARAIKGAPARQPEWAKAYDTAMFWAGMQDAKAQLTAGNAQRAKTILSALTAQKRPDDWNAELLLGEAELKLGNKPAAEQAYRHALAGKPGNTDALVGLASVLTVEGKSDEATRLAARLSVVDRARIGGGSGNAQADLLRIAAKDAAARGDIAAAREKFQQAVSADAKNPWLRLDFARFLARSGAAAQAFATVDPTATGDTPVGLHAAAIFDDEQHRPADALAKLDRIPAAARTSDIAKLRGDILTAGTMERAKMLAAAGKRDEARKLLVVLFHDPDLKPADRAGVPRALAALGDSEGAAQLYREAASDRGPDATKAALDYAWMQLKNGNDTQASGIVSQIEANGGAAAAGPDLQKLKLALAVRKADAMRRKGDVSGAIAALGPLLRTNPGDPALLTAMGRAYGDAGQKRQALRYFETAHQRNPDNADALAALIDGSVQAGDTGAARRYLSQAMSAHPNNARFYYLEAQLARAEGDTRGALRALEIARGLNRQRPDIESEGSSAPPGSGGSGAPPSAAGAMSAGAGSSAPDDGRGMPKMGQSADSDDLVADPAPGRPVQVASLPAQPDTLAEPQPAAATAPIAATGDKRPQLAQLELNVPEPIGGYQPPIYTGPAPAQDSLQLDIERSMAAIEAESSPVLQGGLVYRWRDGTDGLSALSEIGLPMEASFSPWLTGTMKVAVSPVWLDTGSVSGSNLSQFGANQMLNAAGLPMVSPGEQQAGGVIASLSYGYGPWSAKIGEAAWGFPVTNLIGNVAYQPKFLDGQLSVRLELLRNPVTDSLLSYAGTRGTLTTANAITNGQFGARTTWGGVTKTGVRGAVFYDDNNVGAFGILGAAYMDGTNVPENGTFDAVTGVYFRPWKTDTDAVRVGVNLSYFGFDKNLSFYSFGQGGYFSPQNYEALTFPVEYQGRWDKWSWLAAVALGVQHFNTSRSPFFPNNANAQATLVSLVGPAQAYYSGTNSTGLATDLRAQVEYAIDKSLAVGASAQYDNGNSYNEGIVKLYVRKTFSEPQPVAAILPGTPMEGPK